MSLVLQKGVGSENPSIQRKLLRTFQTAQMETSRILPAEMSLETTVVYFRWKPRKVRKIPNSRVELRRSLPFLTEWTDFSQLCNEISENMTDKKKDYFLNFLQPPLYIK